MPTSDVERLNQLSNQFELNESDLVVNSSLVGSDFLATTIRAWPQFFFGVVLPFPLVQAFSFVLAAYLWTKRAKEVRDNNILTDEFILSFLVMQKHVKELDSVALANYSKVLALIEKLKEKDAERMGRLEAFLRNDKNKGAIENALKANVEPYVDTDTDYDKYSQKWAKVFSAACQFATAHWVLWMAGALLYYSQGRWEFETWHGVHKEFAPIPTDIPGAFEDNTAFALQFALPAAITLGAILYNFWYRKTQEQNTAQYEWTKRQEMVRGEYLLLSQEARLSDAEANGNNSQTNPLINTNAANKGEFTEGRVVALSLGTAFWDAFLVGNLLAWPVTAFIDRMVSNKDNRGEALDSETKILTVFSAVMLMCAINVFFKYVNMKKELRDHGMSGTQHQDTYATSQTFCQYYQSNPRVALNIFFDRFSGSGGILAIRFICDGGIGGYLHDKKDPSSMHPINEVLPIALTAMVLMIALNLWQTYYAAQRQVALSATKDNTLIEKARSSRLLGNN